MAASDLRGDIYFRVDGTCRVRATEPRRHASPISPISAPRSRLRLRFSNHGSRTTTSIIHARAHTRCTVSNLQRPVSQISRRIFRKRAQFRRTTVRINTFTATRILYLIALERKYSLARNEIERTLSKSNPSDCFVSI